MPRPTVRCKHALRRGGHKSSKNDAFPPLRP